MKTLAILTLAASSAVAASGAWAQERGRVISSSPITQHVAVPQQVCTDQTVAVAPQPSGAGTVVGAIAGGLLGNAVGSGGGRAAATAAGVVGGALLGNHVEASGPAQYQTVRQCSTQNFYQNRIVGYDVSYEYNGRNYTTQTTEPPGQWIALDVQPAASYGNTAPQGYYGTQPQPQTVYPNTYSTQYSEPYPAQFQSGYGAPLPAAPATVTTSSSVVAPLLIGAVIGAGAYYATRPQPYYHGYRGHPGYRGPGFRPHHGHRGHGWRR